MLELAAGVNDISVNINWPDTSTPILNNKTLTLIFDDKLANFLWTEFPRKSKYLDSNKWDATKIPKQSERHL